MRELKAFSHFYGLRLVFQMNSLRKYNAGLRRKKNRPFENTAIQKMPSFKEKENDFVA